MPVRAPGPFSGPDRAPGLQGKNTLLMARRILGRTLLTTREVSTIHGILRRAEWHMKGGPWETKGKKEEKEEGKEEEGEG